MVPLFRRLVRADPALLVTGAVLAVETAALFVRDLPTSAGWLFAGWLLIAADWAALPLRRRRPVAFALGSLAVALVYYPTSAADGFVPVTVFVVALYNLARTGYLAAAVALPVVITLFIAYGELRHSGERHVDNMAIALFAGWFVSIVAFGHAMRVREAYQREAERRAAVAERERDARARQSATEERLRLARELHDVLGHNISLINVQAAAALHRSVRRPGQTAELVTALEFVRDASKEALRELRATLGVLRQVDEAAPTEPSAGLERLADLVARASATGLKVSVETTGEAPVLPPGISLAAYRIVQESLTNVTRHADADRVWITVAYAPDELRVSVADDGGGAPEGTAHGSGITGMRERARALGGDLTAAPTPTGFRVTARLPLRDGVSAAPSAGGP
jgi:signal transduction histidine kinase